MVFLSLLEEQNSLFVVRQEDMDGDSSDDQLTRHSNDSGDDAQPSKQAAQLWRCDNIVLCCVFVGNFNGKLCMLHTGIVLNG